MKIDRVKIYTVMVRKGMTQADLSEKSGLASCTISKAINGRKCHMSTAVKIADALEVNVSEITEDLNNESD